MTTDPHRDRILIIDYGSQYTQLIARRIREQKVYCEIQTPSLCLEEIEAWRPAGIILSGVRGSQSCSEPTIAFAPRVAT